MRGNALFKPLARTSATAAAFMVSCQSAHAQQLGSGRAVEIPIVQILAGLVLCSLVAFGVVVMMRANKGRLALPPLPLLHQPKLRDPDRIRVVETLRLSAHADVSRFTSGNREYLVITSAGGATIVRQTELEPDAPPPSAGRAG